MSPLLYLCRLNMVQGNVSELKVSRRAGVVAYWENLLQQWHSLWTSVQVLAPLFPTHLLVNAPKKAAEYGPSA